MVGINNRKGIIAKPANLFDVNRVKSILYYPARLKSHAMNLNKLIDTFL